MQQHMRLPPNATAPGDGLVNIDSLSAREREVARFATRGLTNKAIARELNITEGTIKIHLHHIYQKLGIRGRFALVALVNGLPTEDRLTDRS